MDMSSKPRSAPRAATNLVATEHNQPLLSELDQSMDRRGFFRKLCVLSASLVIPAACSQDSSTSLSELPSENIDSSATGSETKLSRVAFANNLNTTMSVTHDSIGVVDLQLSHVNDEMVIPEADQFALTLVGPTAPLLEEKTYEVYNENIGYFELYIQPVSASGGQQNYIAIFSLLNS